MKKVLLILCAAGTAVSVAAQGNETTKPKISMDVLVSTRAGVPRVFHVKNGSIQWSPSLPVRQGDRLMVTFSVSDSIQPTRVWVSLDDRALADLKRPPWKALIDTSGLAPGKHIVRSDLRFPGTPRMYSIADFTFYIQDAPVEVKGTVEELGHPTEAEPSDSGVAPTFTPPAADLIKPDIKVALQSLDPAVDQALRTGKPIHVKKPIVFRLDAKPGVDRWAYIVTRNRRRIAGAGPVARYVYLEVAPKIDGAAGFLPGRIVLRAWGVRNDGAYSEPTEVPLVIEGEEETR